MNQHLKINYLELPASDLDLTKAFYAKVFNWQFTDYGPEYTAFSHEAGLDGGFYASDLSAQPANGSVLVVFYSNDLEQTHQAVIAAGGEICQDIFSFPGGRRFHFKDPSGNELAVWSE
ncbi:VOC family protein [Marinicella meishanensis]|uniref:VOC family protein n=1 Tax=Marinicella meishanensis TaxID=2873263 RepID=UPI001CBDA985|nr:VOC family protein [Marinicella sp. NBU2979]